MIDFHCHLDLYPDPHQVAEGCRECGAYVLSVTTTPSAWEGTRALEDDSDRIRTALGLHPQLAHERRSELALFDELLPQARYVGEIGLDGAPEFRRHWTTQLIVFEHILNACANAGGRILSIHSRRASRPVLDCLEAHAQAGVPVLHWFTGSIRDLYRAISIGCWFSVGPAMLRSKRGKVLAARMPHERVLTESDGPFAQIDGVALLPWQAKQAIYILADLWSLPSGEIERLMLRNLRSLVASVPSNSHSAPLGN